MSLSPSEPRLAVPRLLASLSQETFPEFHVHGVQTPLVGRAQELETLLEVVDDARQSRHLQQALVSGAEGLGKSRLLKELADMLDASPYEVQVWRAEANHTPTSAVVMVAQMLRGRFGIDPGDGDDTVRKKLDHGLSTMVRPKRKDEAVALLGSLLGLPIPPAMLHKGYPHPAAFRRRALRAFGRMVRRDSGGGVQVLMFDGVHKIDHRHASLLAEMLEGLSDCPVVAILCGRGPTKFPPAVHNAPIHRVELHPLLPAEAWEMLEGLVGTMDDEAREKLAPVIEAAYGKPQRLEELVRVLVRKGVIDADNGGLEIHPERLTRSDEVPTDPWLAADARLQDLGRTEIEVLTAAAIYGGHFWFDGVLSLLWAGPRGDQQRLPDEDRLEAALHNTILSLMRADLVRYVERSQVVGSVEMKFANLHERNALLRSLDPEQLRRWQLRAGRWMLYVKPVDARAWFRRAAELLDGAGAPREAAQAWLKTADAALAAYEDAEALAAYDAAVERLDGSDPVTMNVVYRGRARIYEHMHDYMAALENWNAVFRCARILSNRVLAGEAMLASGRLLGRLGERVGAREALERARSGFEEVAHLEGRARVDEQFAELEREAGGEGACERALFHQKRALTLWESAGEPLGRARCELRLGAFALACGDLDEAFERASSALETFEELEDGRGIVEALNLQGSVEYVRGAVERAIDVWRRAVRANSGGARERLALLAVNLSAAYLATGNEELAFERAREALDVAEDVDDAVDAGYAHERLALLEAERDRFDVARDHAESAIRAGRKHRDLRLECVGTRILARVAAVALSRGTHVGGDPPLTEKATHGLLVNARKLSDQVDDIVVQMGVLDDEAALLEQQGQGHAAQKLRLQASRLRKRLMENSLTISGEEETLEVTLADMKDAVTGTRRRILEPVY